VRRSSSPRQVWHKHGCPSVEPAGSTRSASGKSQNLDGGAGEVGGPRNQRHGLVSCTFILVLDIWHQSVACARYEAGMASGRFGLQQDTRQSAREHAACCQTRGMSVWSPDVQQHTAVGWYARPVLRRFCKSSPAGTLSARDCCHCTALCTGGQARWLRGLALLQPMFSKLRDHKRSAQNSFVTRQLDSPCGRHCGD
jgi:hypothetical protein